MLVLFQNVMIDIEFLSKVYFWFDLPVPYQITKEKEILIYPISVKDSEIFLSCVDIISIDKNSLNDPKFISMSYLDFLVDVFILNENQSFAKQSKFQLAFLLKKCLKWEDETEIKIVVDEKNRSKIIYKDYEIKSKQFEDIRRIILYQNLIDFDDSYINPEIKEVINEVEQLKMKSIEVPNLERKIAIISAHTGILKSNQIEMTYRSHSALFKEVYGEVDFTTVRTAALIGNMFSKKKNELEDWIYKKKQNKYGKYFTSQEEYKKSMGGNNSIQS